MSMYLGIVLCVTGVQGNCLQIQATVQVDSGNNVPRKGTHVVQSQTCQCHVSVCMAHNKTFATSHPPDLLLSISLKWPMQ
jgi:hypothetical protein